MLRPHLIMTALIFIVLGALFMHLAAQHHWIGNNGTTTAGSGSTTTTSSSPAPVPEPSPIPTTGSRPASTSNGGASVPDIGPHGTIPPSERAPAPTTTARNDDGRGSYDEPRSNDRYGRGDNVPGQFDYYALVLSWSPTYCAEKGGSGDPMQCNPTDGRRYSFILHGLWPQYERGYPDQCQLQRQPFVPQAIIDRMLDIMPSRGLVIHEYRAHGTCSGLDPDRYFTLAHRLFDGIIIPPRFRNPADSQTVSPADVRDEFQRANSSLNASSIAVVCGSGRLKEVRLCLSKEGRPRNCGDNENPRRLCSLDRMTVPPARSASASQSSDSYDRPSYSRRNSDSPLPGPNVDWRSR